MTAQSRYGQIVLAFPVVMMGILKQQLIPIPPGKAADTKIPIFSGYGNRTIVTKSRLMQVNADSFGQTVDAQLVVDPVGVLPNGTFGNEQSPGYLLIG